MSVSLDRQGDVALITFDDGGKNVVTNEVLDQLNAAFDEAEAQAGAIVLAGRPGIFCAGFDMQTMIGDDPGARARLSGGGGRLALRIMRCPKPLVGACTGHAFTIGAVWLLGCDNRVGERGAFRIAMTETKLGVPFGPWSIAPLQALLNPQLFTRVVVQSEPCDPEMAITAGFLDEVVDAGGSVARACEIAEGLAQLPGKAYAATKLLARKDLIATMEADLPAA